MTGENKSSTPNAPGKKTNGDDASGDSTERITAGSRWFWIVMSITMLAAAIFALGFVEDTADVTHNPKPSTLPVVSVEQIKTAPQQAMIRSFAEVQPRWSVELTASVTGKVTKVFDTALAGEPVESGAKLIEIENSRYVAELAAAEQAHKQAKLALWQARNATLLARNDFKRNNSEPPNDLALKLPQLDIAESAEVSAEARVKAARKELDNTTIAAPFSAFVTNRFVSPGQSVNPGDRLLKLVDKSSFELVAEIGRDDWALLGKPLSGQVAHLLNQDGEVIEQATVRRGGGFLDEKTRQHRIFLRVDSPATGKLLSGDFVTVVLQGITIDRALNIPSSALTREGFVWIVDAANELQRIEPKVIFRSDDRVIVRAPEQIDDWRVAITPLESFLAGRKVEPRYLEN